MGKPKGPSVPRETVVEILKHFGQQPYDKRCAFLRASGLKVADCLPPSSKWKKIAASAAVNGWKSPINTQS